MVVVTLIIAVAFSRCPFEDILHLVVGVIEVWCFTDNTDALETLSCFIYKYWDMNVSQEALSLSQLRWKILQFFVERDVL